MVNPGEFMIFTSARCRQLLLSLMASGLISSLPRPQIKCPRAHQALGVRKFWLWKKGGWAGKKQDSTFQGWETTVSGGRHQLELPSRSRWPQESEVLANRTWDKGLLGCRGLERDKEEKISTFLSLRAWTYLPLWNTCLTPSASWIFTFLERPWVTCECRGWKGLGSTLKPPILSLWATLLGLHFFIYTMGTKKPTSPGYWRDEMRSRLAKRICSISSDFMLFYDVPCHKRGRLSPRFLPAS